MIKSDGLAGFSKEKASAVDGQLTNRSFLNVQESGELHREI